MRPRRRAGLLVVVATVVVLASTVLACAKAKPAAESGGARGSKPPRRALDPSCPVVVAAVDAAVTEIPSAAIARAASPDDETRTSTRLRELAARIGESAATVRDEELLTATRYAAWATETVAGMLGAVAPADPSLDLALRQRDYAYVAARAWCSEDTTRAQSDRWADQARARILAAYPEVAACYDPTERRAIAAGGLVLTWRALVEADGHVSFAAPLGYPGKSPPARGSLCVLRTLERMTFAAPDGRAVIGSDFAFGP